MRRIGGFMAGAQLATDILAAQLPHRFGEWDRIGRGLIWSNTKWAVLS